jgi:hypothetical protein
MMVIPTERVCGDLILDGDFEQGHAAFTTDYTYSTDLTASGTVVVGADPQDYHPAAASFGDHTWGDGRMLIVNGSTDGNATVWGQTVSVKPGTQYAFLYWCSAWTPAADIRQAEIRCLINELRVGAAGFSGTAVGQWSCVLLRWNSGPVSQANIRLADRTGTEADNDFALDDIDMVEVGDGRVLVTAATVGGTVEAPGKGVFVYPEGQQVCLEATCRSGYEFAGWGGNFFDLDPVMWIDMNADCVAVARFKKLDYDVTIRASGAAPNEFSTCADSVDRLSTFLGALDSLDSSGLVIGSPKGVCSATYRFPILRPKAGIQEITRIVVHVYGSTVSAGPAVRIGDSGRYPWLKGDLHLTFMDKAVADLLGSCEGLVCWLPIKVAAPMGACDLASVYVSYDCPGISRSLLRRFHDHLSIYQALESYAHAPEIRDLYGLKASRQQTWEAVLQTLALAEDLGASSDALPTTICTCVEELDGSLTHWQSLANCSDPTILGGVNPQAIVTCLDDAVSSGQSYIAAYAEAIADGHVVAGEASQLNQSGAGWKADLVVLDTAMSELFRSLGEVNRHTADPVLRDAAQRMIQAMIPWYAGEPDDLGVWVPSSPTYLEQVIETLQDFPVEDIVVP